MNWLGELVQRHVNPDDTVLDIGCGIMPALDGLVCKSYLGVDIWMKYLDQIKNKQNTMQMDVTKDLAHFPDSSYDVVTCLDLLEHLDIIHLVYVLEHIKRVCRKKTIIFTPSSFISNESAAKNAWGLGECGFQHHKCLVPLELLLKHGFHVRTDNVDQAYFGVYIKNGN